MLLCYFISQGNHRVLPRFKGKERTLYHGMEEVSRSYDKNRWDGHLWETQWATGCHSAIGWGFNRVSKGVWVEMMSSAEGWGLKGELTGRGINRYKGWSQGGTCVFVWCKRREGGKVQCALGHHALSAAPRDIAQSVIFQEQTVWRGQGNQLPLPNW